MDNQPGTGRQHIRLEVSGGLARLTLRRPPLNILNIAMMREINEALDELRAGTSAGREAAAAPVKLLVIEAEGRAFSAGVDIAEHTAEKVAEMIETFHGIFRRLDRLDVLTLAVVQGAALGGGCELALFCDLVIAAENARFAQPEIKAGVFPPIAAILLPRIAPPKVALELLATGEAIDATEARRLGLVNAVVPADGLRDAAEHMAGRLLALSGSVLGLTKRASRAGAQGSFSAALDEVEALYLNDLMRTEDAHEGLAAFLEKRPPRWTDR